MPDNAIAIAPKPLITEPGIYDGISLETYHGDITPTPALSSSGARTLANECPRMFWHKSPMNPAFVREHKKAFDLGNAGHYMALEPDLFAKKITVIDAADYKTNAAKQLRDDAYAAGQVPLLTHELAIVNAMREELFADPIARHAFAGGTPEQTMVWQDYDFGIWRKARPDYVPEDSARYLVDYKTSGSANPDDFARVMDNVGYHMQGAWYLDGVEALTGTRPKKFFFVVQSTKAPFLVSTVEADKEDLEWGRIQNRVAIRTFWECLSKGTGREHWPGYTPKEARLVSLPYYRRRELEERLKAGDFADPVAAIAFAGQAPQ